MASPFSVFRKHQKSLMVVLVIGSMIAFTGESLFTGGGANFVLFGVLAGTTLALIAGFQAGKPMEYAIAGAVLGGVVGFFVPKFQGGQGIASAVGTFDQNRVDKLVQRRQIAQSFLNGVRGASLSEQEFRIQQMLGQSPSFHLVGNYSLAQDVILGELLRAEADEMGLYVGDKAINDFLDRATMEKLKSSDMKRVREKIAIGDKPLSEAELYETLREALTARIVFDSLIPFTNDDQATPDEYWEMFQRLNVRQKLDHAKIPVAAFLDQVGEPSDAELRDLFEKYRDKLPEKGEPGFFQPSKLKLAWVEVERDLIASAVSVTEDDVEKQYEADKSLRYRKIDTDPDDPKPGDPEDATGMPPETPAEKKPAEDGKSGKAAGDEADSGADGAAGKKEEGDEGCFQEPPETKSDEKAQDNTTKQNPLKIPSTPKSDQGDTDPFLEKPEYMPLDDDLRRQIRKELEAARVDEEYDKRVTEIMNFMRRLDEQREDRLLEGTGPGDVELCQRLKAFAEDKGYIYAETPLVGYNDLSDPDEYPIGSAMPPNTMFQSGAVPVAQKMFANGGPGVFTPGRAQRMKSLVQPIDTTIVSEYAYWSIAEIPAHEPLFDEPRLREQVVRAWKMMKARPLAEARAKDLAEQLKSGAAEGKSLSEMLEAETQTGKPSGAKIVVTSTDAFSWLQSSSAASPFGQPRTSLTSIEGFKITSADVMKYIFRELENGEVGSVGNYDQTEFYVVRPLERFPLEPDDQTDLQDRFLKEVMASQAPPLVRGTYADHNGTWLQNIEKKYGVNWSEAN